MEERKKIHERRFYPLLISEGNRSDKEDEKIWDTFDTLSEEKKESLLSPEVAENLQLLETQFHLREDVTVKISITVRGLFFGEISEENLDSYIDSLLQKVGSTEGFSSQDITSFIRTKILTIKPRPKEVKEEEFSPADFPAPSLQKLQILEALARYPNLGNQNITESRIRIKSQPDPVRGSLYSWIKCYRDELGIGQHSTVERGQFLFRSENSKNLPSEERERINLILKSIEENYALDIDTEKQMIVFPTHATEKAQMPSQENASKAVLTPQAFFAPRPAIRSEESQLVTSASQKDAFASGKAAIAHQFVPEKKTLATTSDFSHEAEKLKREPKPEWIKGAFTKESIPDNVQAESVKGSMSFSLNHVLPVEQETEKQEAHIQFTNAKVVSEDSTAKKEALPKKAPDVQSQPRRNQFHIRPVSRNDF
jgi:hypothetical protein